MQSIILFLFIICFYEVITGINSTSLDFETPKWKTDNNRMILQSNEVPTPSQIEKHQGMAPRYRYRNNKRERYYPKPMSKNDYNLNYRQKQNSQSNLLGRLLNPNEYPPNWNGGYYKYHQEGRASIPHVGANVNVPIKKGNFRTHRNKIVTTIIKPGDEWKYADLLKKSASPGQSSNHRQRTDSIYPNDDPRINRKKHKKHCVMCPEERTLITNKKRDKVLFEAPKLKSCLGRPLHSKYTFKSIYGAKPGDLLPPGTHVLVGEIHYRNKSLQTCHLRVNVITKQCSNFETPSDLKLDCDAGNNWGSQCVFHCANPSHAILGENEIFCNDDLKWVGTVPTCKKKSNSCDIPLTDLHVQLLCNTSDVNQDIMDNDAEEASKLPEGTHCRVECDRGYKTTPRGSSAVCVQGDWHGNLSVSCRRHRRKAQRSLRRSINKRRNLLHSV